MGLAPRSWRKNGDRKIGTAMICRSLGIGSVISRINTNSTQISIARSRTTATIILACHRSQQCWFQFRKTTKFFEHDKINQNFVSIVCICSVNLLCYLFGEIYLYFSWIVHTQKNLHIPDLTLKNRGSEMIGKKSKNRPINRDRWSDLAALNGAIQGQGAPVCACCFCTDMTCHAYMHWSAIGLLLWQKVQGSN